VLNQIFQKFLSTKQQTEPTWNLQSSPENIYNYTKLAIDKENKEHNIET